MLSKEDLAPTKKIYRPKQADQEVIQQLTSKIIRTEHPKQIETAMAQGRAADRYQTFRVICRKSPVPNAYATDPTHLCYGQYLARTVLLSLEPRPDGSNGERTPPVVELHSILHWGRPYMTQAQADLVVPMPPPMIVEWFDRKRPIEDVLELAPRVLGPLPPPPLLDVMLPRHLTQGQASKIFAYWMAGQPLPYPEREAAAAAAKKPPPKRTWGQWFGGLWSGAKKEKKETPAAAPAAPTAAEPAGPAAGAAEGVPSTPEEAWAMYEKMVREREPGYNTELEKEWFEQILLYEGAPVILQLMPAGATLPTADSKTAAPAAAASGDPAAAAPTPAPVAAPVAAGASS